MFELAPNVCTVSDGVGVYFHTSSDPYNCILSVRILWFQACAGLSMFPLCECSAFWSLSVCSNFSSNCILDTVPRPNLKGLQISRQIFRFVHALVIPSVVARFNHTVKQCFSAAGPLASIIPGRERFFWN